ncbi:MAG: SDR family oxidoreductase [Alphaproteobacteria bacterium]|nr:SDR family oxidoreductase [Alphaproteobacteria bacterium]
MANTSSGDFAGQTALVTGAARGLGRAISTLLAQRGARVFMVDLDGAGVEAAANELSKSGFDAIAAQADVADEAQLGRVKDMVVARGGRLDVLVNNAGGWRYGTLDEITLEDWDWTFRVNLTTVFLTTRTFKDLMIARRYGRIVNVASTDGYRPKPKLPHYAAAKAAVVSLTKTMAEELGPHEVLVNGVSPGAIATETAKAQGWLKERIPFIPVRRVAEPGDIAEVILYLASPRNRFVVGETVMVNGGMLMV